jgi:hypothetical protein
VKEFLKPTKKKLIVSVILTIFWIFIKKLSAPLVNCMCIQGGFDNCTDYYRFLLIKQGCHCTCFSLPEVLLQYFWNLIVPFVIAYLIYSIIELVINLRKRK